MEFSSKKHWSGLPFPSPGDLPDPGIEPGSSTLQADSLLSEPPGTTLRVVDYFFLSDAHYPWKSFVGVLWGLTGRCLPLGRTYTCSVQALGGTLNLGPLEIKSSKLEKARVGWFERVALKHVYYHMWNRSLVQVRYMRQGAQGWCTGMTQRDGMGREVRGGFRMGNTCTPMADSCQCMEKPLQYCKVISLQLK